MTFAELSVGDYFSFSKDIFNDVCIKADNTIYYTIQHGIDITGERLTCYDINQEINYITEINFELGYPLDIFQEESIDCDMEHEFTTSHHIPNYDIIGVVDADSNVFSPTIYLKILDKSSNKFLCLHNGQGTKIVGVIYTLDKLYYRRTVVLKQIALEEVNNI